MVNFFIILLSLFSMAFGYYSYPIVNNGNLYALAEMGYMEGQIDAINSDVRVESYENTYRWVKSPWDRDDKSPAYVSLRKYKEQLTK